MSKSQHNTLQLSSIWAYKSKTENYNIVMFTSEMRRDEVTGYSWSGVKENVWLFGALCTSSDQPAVGRMLSLTRPRRVTAENDSCVCVDSDINVYFMTFFVLLSLTTVSAVLQTPIISLQSSVTIATCLASVYHTHNARMQNTQSIWNKHASTRSRLLVTLA